MFCESSPSPEIVASQLAASRREMYTALQLFHTHVKHTISMMLTLLTAVLAVFGYLLKGLDEGSSGYAQIRIIAAILLFLLLPLAWFSRRIITRHYDLYVCAIFFAKRLHDVHRLTELHPRFDQIALNSKTELSVDSRISAAHHTLRSYTYVISTIALAGVGAAITILSCSAMCQKADLLLFDFDGVIVDSLAVFHSCFMAACNLEGYSQYSSIQCFLRLFDGNLYERMLEANLPERIVRRVIRNTKKCLSEDFAEVVPFPGMKRLLRDLGRHHRILVITANSGQVVRTYLARHRLVCVSEVFGEECGWSKQEKILDAIRGFQYDRCFFIGDTTGDVREAQAAGVPSVAVSWGWHRRQWLVEAEPSFLVDSVGELGNLLRYP